MKRKLILFYLIVPVFALGQITIVSTDLPLIGDTIPRQQDTLTVSTEGPSGANQIWDFSNAAAHVVNNTAILNPSATPYSSNFSGSNMAMSNDGASYVYLSSYTDSFITDGAAGDLLGTGEILKAQFKPSLTLNKYPTAYGNNYQDTYGFDVSADGSSFNILLDSIRLKHSATVYDTVDGWGTIITPTGSYNSLRVKRIEYSIDSIWTLPVFGFPPAWAFLDAFIDTATTYSWLAKEGKLAIAELNFDTLDNPNVLTWSLMPASPIALFSFTDNGSGGFSFSDISENGPTSWSWDFGDGNTSNLQNPSNQYTIDSTYYVCLTISNSAGSDTYCDSVVVTGVTGNPPPIANFSYVDNGGGNVGFTDLSLNSPNSWTWDFDDGNTSTQANPTHQYLADSTYVVCLTVINGNGSDSYCDSIVITGTSTILPPIASFSWIDNGGGYATFTDLSSNAPTSWAWDFGDGNTSSQQHPDNIYTIHDSTYNVCLTATNSAGNDSYCDSVLIVDTIIALPVRESISNSFDITFIPNPASEKTSIQFSDNYLAAEIDLCLFNAIGQKVFQENFKIKPGGNFEIDLNQLKAGVYFYFLKETGSDKAGSGKLVIE